MAFNQFQTSLGHQYYLKKLHLAILLSRRGVRASHIAVTAIYLVDLKPQYGWLYNTAEVDCRIAVQGI